MSRLDRWYDISLVVSGPTFPNFGYDKEGELWWNDQSRALYIFYDGGWQHINSSPNLPAPTKDSIGGTVFISSNPPVVIDKYEGDLWYNPVLDKLCIYIQSDWTEITMFS